MKKVVEFEEQKAIEIIKNFSLSPKTIGVWRLRGRIPEKYFSGKFRPRGEKISVLEMARLSGVLKSGKINISVLVRPLKSIRYEQLIDALKNKSIIEREQYIEIKTAVNRIRVAAKKLVDSQDFERDFPGFVRDYTQLKLSVVFEKKVLDLKAGKHSVVDADKYRDNLAVFVLETSLE